MSIAIVPDTITISTDDTEVRIGVLRMLLRNAAGYVVTVRTLDEPDGTDLYVLAPRPDQHADHLYGAAHAVKSTAGLMVTVTRPDGIRANLIHRNEDNPGTADGSAPPWRGGIPL